MSIDLLKKSFDISQSIPKDNEYKLQLIKLSNINIIFKEIANHEFFHHQLIS